MIRQAQSNALDPRQAVREFHSGVAQPDMALVIFFCSKEYDLDELASEIKIAFGRALVVGCTTAGEIGPIGKTDHSITGASFSTEGFTATVGSLDHLHDFMPAQAEQLVQELMQRLESADAKAAADNSFALLLIDGSSGREEIVGAALQRALGALPLVGGSAGDGLEFARPLIYHDGVFESDSALLILVTTEMPFTIFMTQHYTVTDKRVVVTSADRDRRLIREIDGRPALEVYSELTGVSIDNLNPAHFAGSPLVVLIDGGAYVRGIQKANPDGSLTLFSAIEEGVVLRAAVGQDLVENLTDAFADLRAEIGPPELVIGCDCLFRKLEVTHDGLTDRVAALFRENNVVGFNGYGEQYRGVHVNQTLTGVAIGRSAT